MVTLSYQTGSAPSTPTLRIPSCLSSDDTIDSVVASNVIVSVESFPPPLQALSLSACVFDESSYDTNDNLDWVTLLNRSSFTQLTITNSRLRGPLPNVLPASLWYFDVSNNFLSGSINPGFGQQLINPSHLHIDLSQNRKDNISSSGLSGFLPPDLFGTLDGASLSHFRFFAHGNKLSGLLPSPSSSPGDDASGLFPRRVLGEVNVNLADNSLSGNIPFDLLSNLDSSQNNNIKIILSSNRLDGPVPDLIGSFTNVSSFTLDLSSTRVETLPSSFPSSLQSLSLLFKDNEELTSTIPNTLVSNLVQLNSFTFQAQNTKLTGSLPSLIDNIPLSQLSLTIDLSNVTTLNNLLPAILVNSSLGALNFKAPRSGINGAMPTIDDSNSITNYILDLSSTAIDFCTSTRSPWRTMSGDTFQCNLLDTSAATSCPNLYPSACFDPIVTPTPFSSPSPSPNPTAPVPLSPVPSSASCSNGTCIYNNTDTPILVIPPGTIQTIINGNISSATIILPSLGSSVNVTGCITNLTSIVITLQESDLEQIQRTGKLTQILLQQSSNSSSCSSLENVSINVRPQKDSCKKAKAQRQVSLQNGTLSALFTLDTSKCKIWWIVLVSVLAGIVLIAVLIVALLVAFVPRVRGKILPYSKASQNRRAGGVE